jgi:DNA-binding transcriptional LysR family regulator
MLRLNDVLFLLDQRPPRSGGRVVSLELGRRSLDASNARPAQDRHLAIGLSAPLGWGFLRDLIKDFRAAKPGVALRFVEAPVSEQVELLRRRQLDVLFVQGRPEVNGLSAEELWREPLFVALPERDRLARQNEVDPDELAEPILLDCRGATGCSAVSPETAMNLVGMDLGLAVVPGAALGVYHPGVVYRPLAGASVPFSAVSCEDGGPDVKALLGVARAKARSGRARSGR